MNQFLNHEFVNDGNGFCKICRERELPQKAVEQAELDLQ